MSSNHTHRSTVAMAALLMTTSLALASCGGGSSGGNIASAPPPLPGPAAPAETTTASAQTPPATTTGSYTGISTFASSEASGGSPGLPHIVAPEQLAPEGSVRLAVDASTRTYTLTVTAGPYTFPGGAVTMPDRVVIPLTGGSSDPSLFSPAAQIARGELLSRTVGAGTDANGVPKAMTTWIRPYYFGNSDVQPRYLSAAGWGQFYSESASGSPGAENYKPTQATTGFMVYGQRTEPDDIPVSGRARYALESQHGGFDHPFTDEDGNRINPDGDTVLDIDFATRKLSATYDLTSNGPLFRYDANGKTVTDSQGYAIVEGQLATAIHADGSTIVGNSGSFSLSLSGTGLVHAERAGQPPIPDISRPVSGDITGAFFGPQAAEVGGIWNLPVAIEQDGAVSMIRAAFAGLREKP